MALHLRRRADGTLHITGEDAPDEHEFPMSWLSREMGKFASVQVTLHTDDGDVVYDVTGFPTPPDSQQPNYSALVATKNEKLSTHKRFSKRSSTRKKEQSSASGKASDPREDKS